MKSWRDPGSSRREARARLRPGNFQGTPPRGRSHDVEEAAIERIEGEWFATSRYQRRARVTGVETLTSTGTVRLAFEVVDGQPFDFLPGQFVGLEAEFAGLGYRRSPYCILSPPLDEPRFEILVRTVPQGPLSLRLAELQPGEEVAFRGPNGRPMVPRFDDRHLVLLATGTGVAPFCSLARHLLDGGYPEPIELWWGLRLVDDICLTEELDELARRYPHFGYHITLSQPAADWTGLRGRIGESMPPLLESLGGKDYYLVGNGAMLEEMAQALSDLGVIQKYIHTEPFFDAGHRADPEVVAAIRERFVATDLYSAHAARRGSLFDLDRGLDAVRSGKAGSGDPQAASDLFELLPSFLSHHPDQENPAPTHVERPWNRPY
ncbi:MAG TPA: FAD-dependent oxidoreductase [Acidimicrobiales bacterium]|nr:FAD-dependent oxidoreductase [Acidimicrobiales bacterium]